MAESMQLSWARRWLTTSTLAPQLSGSLLLTHLAQPSCRTTHPRHASEQVRCVWWLSHSRATALSMRLKTGITAPRNQRPGYPPRIQMDLDHFVCAGVVVRQMCELYDKSTVGGPRPGKSQISRDQFLETVISLP